jgi:hypothetical protein
VAISDIEYFGDRIKTLISDTISDTLDTIDGERGRTYETEDIRRYAIGRTEVQGEFPALSVMSVRETPTTDEGDWQITSFEYLIEVYTTGDDANKLERNCARYGRAIKQILWTQWPWQGFIDAVDYPPAGVMQGFLFKGVMVSFRLLVPRGRS